MLTFEVYYFDWFAQFFIEWRQTSKLVIFQDFFYGPTMRFKWKFENDKNFLILFHSSTKHL